MAKKPGICPGISTISSHETYSVKYVDNKIIELGFSSMYVNFIVLRLIVTQDTYLSNDGFQRSIRVSLNQGSSNSFPYLLSKSLSEVVTLVFKLFYCQAKSRALSGAICGILMTKINQ